MEELKASSWLPADQENGQIPDQNKRPQADMQAHTDKRANVDKHGEARIA